MREINCLRCGGEMAYIMSTAAKSAESWNSSCPACGKRHDFDYPKCPNCGHDYNAK